MWLFQVSVSDYAGIGLTSMHKLCTMIREVLAVSNRYNSVSLGGNGEIGYVDEVHIGTRKKYGLGDERGLRNESGKKLYLLMMNDLNSQNIQIRIIKSKSVGFIRNRPTFSRTALTLYRG